MNLGKTIIHEDDPGYGDSETFYAGFHDRLPTGDADGLFRYAHKAMERPYPANEKYSDVIEVGAGTGNDLGFVRHEFMRYELTDFERLSQESERFVR